MTRRHLGAVSIITRRAPPQSRRCVTRSYSATSPIRLQPQENLTRNTPMKPSSAQCMIEIQSSRARVSNLCVALATYLTSIGCAGDSGLAEPAEPRPTQTESSQPAHVSVIAPAADAAPLWARWRGKTGQGTLPSDTPSRLNCPRQPSRSPGRNRSGRAGLHRWLQTRIVVVTDRQQGQERVLAYASRRRRSRLAASAGGRFRSSRGGPAPRQRAQVDPGDRPVARLQPGHLRLAQLL